MDSHLAAVLKRSRANLLDKTCFSEGEDQPTSVNPLTLTETQVQPIDLSLKSPCAYFHPQDHKEIFPCDQEKKQSHLGKKRGQRCVLREVEDKTDLEIVSREASLCDSLSSEGGSTAVSSVDLNNGTDSLVDVKEEIEEVCIGEQHECCEDNSCTPVFLNEKNTADKDSSENAANGAKGNRDAVANEAIATTTAEPQGILMDRLGILAKDTAEQQTSAVESQQLDLNVNIKYPAKTTKGLSRKIPLKSKSCLIRKELSSKGLSAQSSDEVEEGRAKFGKQGSDSSLTPARRGKGPCGLEDKMDNETNADVREKSKGVKQKAEEGEALNLSLSKKNRKRGAHSIDQLLEEETLKERPVIKMEVNEKNKQNDCSLRKGESVNVSQWESNLPPTFPVTSPQSPDSASEDCDAAGLLLIDDQGIPYILTPDGEKVLQVTPSKSCKGSTVSLNRQEIKRANVKDSPVVLCDGELPKKDSIQAPTCMSKEVSLHHNSEELLESSETVTPLHTMSNQDTSISSSSSESPSQSNLATRPVQAVGSPTSNVVLVSSSHFPNPPTTKPKSSSNLLALSLPISLNQNPPSAPLLLVLSPVKTSPNPPSSSTSTLNVTDPMPSALVPSKTQSSSPTSAVGSSSQTGCSPSPDDPDCADPTTSISGNTDCCQPVADSPSTSTSHYDRTVKPDTNPKKVLHKLSPHHDVLNQDDSSQSASPSVETPTKSTSPVSASVCPEETLKSSRDSPSLDPQFLPASNTHDEIFAPDESHYPVCSTPPSTAIFPSNHPKNFTLSSTCPRRILYCQFCPRAFYYLSDLERHSITHSQSKPHVCPLCSKAFKRSSHLERHKHIHTGQRNFICPICSKRFREAGELLRHQRVHTGEKPFQCPLCHMRFAERNTLRRHTKRKHQEPSGQTDTHGMQGSQGESAEWYTCTVPDTDSDTELGKE